jgi:hypothetical protein
MILCSVALMVLRSLKDLVEDMLPEPVKPKPLPRKTGNAQRDFALTFLHDAETVQDKKYDDGEEQSHKCSLPR